VRERGGRDERDQPGEVLHEFAVARGHGLDLAVRALAVERDLHFRGEVLPGHGDHALVHEQVEHGLGQGGGLLVEAQQDDVARLVGFGAGGGEAPPKGAGVFGEFGAGEHKILPWRRRFPVCGRMARTIAQPAVNLKFGDL